MEKDIKVFLLDTNPTKDICNVFQKIFKSSSPVHIQIWKEFGEVSTPALSPDKLLDAILKVDPDIIFLGLSRNYLNQAGQILTFLGKEIPKLPIVVISQSSNPEEMIELLKSGAADFITLPFTEVDILPRIWRLLKHKQTADTLTYKLKEKLGLKHLVGESPIFLSEIKKIPLIAKCDATVLIQGETGTGKEVCARAIHYLSPRAGKPFIPVNCGAIPGELVENELFGHERGAYTGAASLQAGLIQEASGGTLFLDEIDTLPLQIQVKLLRFLQDKEYRPLGSGKLCRADVRIITASNSNLEMAVEEGRFRKDLYYRLNILNINLPPLRERCEDIPLFVHHFLAKYAHEFGKKMMEITPDALQKLALYDWPGNVRELQHVIERVVALSEHTCIQSDDINIPCRETASNIISFQEAKARIVDQFEKDYIKELLLVNEGNITRAARVAKKNRRAFWQLVKKHKIDAWSFKPGQISASARTNLSYRESL
ncbi:MAG: sigma-54 dependent transcriptional regulator [Candidatus Brocadiaceae bacterium]